MTVAEDSAAGRSGAPGELPPGRDVSLRLRAALDRWGLLVLLGLTVAAYAGVLLAGFVWDDHAIVLEDQRTASLSRIPELFTGDMWATSGEDGEPSGYYRPIFLTSLALVRALAGLSAPAFHLHGLVWHLLAVVALSQVLRSLLSARAALVGAALFALHPLQSEAVVWIAANNDPMAAALALFALGAVLDRDAGLARCGAAALGTALACLSKESVVLLPLWLVALDLGRGGLGAGRRVIALSLGVVAALALRAVPGVGGAVIPDAAQRALFFGQLPVTVGLAGSLLVLPWPLSAARAVEWLNAPAWRVALGWVALVGGLGLLLRGPRRSVALAGLAIALMAAAPAALPVATKGLLAERYLYLPMAGVALAVAATAGARAELLIGALCLPWLLAIHLRVQDWASELVLWSATQRDDPSPYADAGMAHALNREGRSDEALALFARAVDAKPGNGQVCQNLVTLNLRLGRLDEALRAGAWAWERGCATNTRFVGAYAVAQAFAGDWDGVEETLKAAREPDPSGRAEVARAALAWVRGDQAQYEAVLAGWQGSEPLEPQVKKILKQGGQLKEDP